MNFWKVSFWRDKWCGELVLSASFLSLFALAVTGEGGGIGELLFHQAFND